MKIVKPDVGMLRALEAVVLASVPRLRRNQTSISQGSLITESFPFRCVISIDYGSHFNVCVMACTLIMYHGLPTSRLSWHVIIPVVCLALCFGFQTWEFVGSHNDITRARKLFAEVRAGWVTSNFMKGQAAVNTTRDYIRAAVFFANTAIILGTFAVGYAGTIYSECPEDGCSGREWLYIVKLAVLSALLVINFFVFTQCTRFAVHFSFCINTEELDGVPLPHSLIVKVFNHSYKYYSLGIRLYFGTIPVFAWIFHAFAMVAITVLYIYLVRGLENADFLRAELDDIKKAKDARSTA